MTSFLVFIFLTLSVIFIVLQNGLYIENISLPNLKAKQLYIKWNENIDIAVKEIQIKTNNSSGESFDLDKFSKILHKLPSVYKIFEKVMIDKIIIDDIVASFKYKKGEDGYLHLQSPKIILKSSLFFESNLLNIKITTLKDTQRDILINGNIILNPIKQTLTSSLNINIHNEVKLNLLTHANKEKLFYKIVSLEDIKSITYLMDKLPMPQEIRYWAYQAIEFSSLSITKLHGWFNFNNLNNAYKNIYVSAIGNDLSYTYNPKLDAIHTKQTNLVFENGVLFIYPKEAYTYKSKLGKSWLKIDFTKKEELLTLYLLFDGKLDKDTLSILEAYKIKIPFLQNTGNTKVDLSIEVFLRTINISAKGSFHTKKSNFHYHGYDIDIIDGLINLDNYDVSIDNMETKFKDVIHSKVDAVFNASTGKGEIDFRVTKFAPKKLAVSLISKNNPLQVKYILSPNKDTIIINPSHWKSYNHIINIARIKIPFNLDTLHLNLPKTELSSSTLGKFNVSGFLDLNKIILDLNIEIQKIYPQNIELDNYANIKFEYNKKLKISSDKKISFTINEKKSFLNPSSIIFHNKKLTVKESYIDIESTLKTKFSAEYDFNNRTGNIETRRMRLYTKDLDLIYFNKDAIRFDINKDNNKTLYIKSDDIDFHFIENEDFWKIDFSSLKLLSINSELLKKYHLDNGTLSLVSAVNAKTISIQAKTIYPYKLMVKNNVELNAYNINGELNTENNVLKLKVNDSLSLQIDETTQIVTENIGININALTSIINTFEDNPSSSKNDIKVSIKANNSYLYISKDRRIVSDEMYLYYAKNILTAGLLYQDGSAGLKYENNHFDAFGKKFNDRFMERLFALSDFKDGEFSFNLSGSTKKYEGIFKIKETTIIDYKVLNNVLAFVNTIPTLVTFATPEYNSKGLRLRKAYMKFTSENDLFYIDDIYFHSKELDILGKGIANFRKNTIDVNLNLKTDIGSNAAKIPVVGYLVLNGNSLSSSLHVNGALDNPDVTTQLAKEIAVAPFNLLMRTLTLPYYYITWDDNKTN